VLRVGGAAAIAARVERAALAQPLSQQCGHPRHALGFLIGGRAQHIHGFAEVALGVGLDARHGARIHLGPLQAAPPVSFR
jgi:hypothetical protein